MVKPRPLTLTPCTRPFIRKVCWGNVSWRTWRTKPQDVSRPKARFCLNRTEPPTQFSPSAWAWSTGPRRRTPGRSPPPHGSLWPGSASAEERTAPEPLRTGQNHRSGSEPSKSNFDPNKKDSQEMEELIHLVVSLRTEKSGNFQLNVFIAWRAASLKINSVNNKSLIITPANKQINAPWTKS